MHTLKSMIRRYMYALTFISVVVILLIILYIQTKVEQRRSYEMSMRTFAQIERILEQNQKELFELRENYRQTCVHNAETIARILEADPDVIYDVEELKEIAKTTEVDEIHVFDDTGRIFAGTHPEYYDYTFDSGEQMSFFKPMLTDKSLQLVQDITPNTAEGKLMQYSALWSQNGDFIVQVGMEPVSIMKITEKNELSYIFSLFSVNVGAAYCAIDEEDGTIVGTTVLEYVGKKVEDLGIQLEDIKDTSQYGFFAIVNEQKYFCVFKKAGDKYLGRIVLSRELYQRIPSLVLQMASCLAVIALILSSSATRYMNRYVVEIIQKINKKLWAITNGNLDETIDAYDSLEFSELSCYINDMIKSLLDNNKKMSYVLSKTNRYIGVYEYNSHMKKVRFTEYVPQILALDEDEAAHLASDFSLFKSFIDDIRKNPVSDETGVFRLNSRQDQYIRLDEIDEHERIFGVVMDVTSEIMQRRKLEFERDMDPLTGLYNRRGIDHKLAALFKEPEKLGHSAFVIIDSDDLKTINDTYGHEKGDSYLNGIATIINNFGPKSCVAARQGGDEFVLFLYQYDTEEELLGAIQRLSLVQEHCTASLNGEVCVKLCFSFGFSLTRPGVPYQELIQEADKKMYKNKWERKKLQI